MPGRWRDLHLSRWWLSPVYCIFVSLVLTQAGSALGFMSGGSGGDQFNVPTYNRDASGTLSLMERELLWM